MAQSNDARALREWLRDCPAIGREAAFGVDYLGAEAGCWAICGLAAVWKRRENILGEAALARRQTREFALDYRGIHSGDPAGNLENLERMDAAAAWTRLRSAAGELPEWTGGRVAAVLPAGPAAVEQIGKGTARYRLRLRVEYELDAPAGA